MHSGAGLWSSGRSNKWLTFSQALLSSCRDRSWLSHVTHGGVFLGVPNLGMKQDHLVTLVEGDPAKELVANLAENSELLMQLNVDFEKHFNFENTEIFSFYETAETPVLRMVCFPCACSQICRLITSA